MCRKHGCNLSRGTRTRGLHWLVFFYVLGLGFSPYSLHAVQKTHLTASGALGARVIGTNLTFPRSSSRSYLRATRLPTGTVGAKTRQSDMRANSLLRQLRHPVPRPSHVNSPICMTRVCDCASLNDSRTVTVNARPPPALYWEKLSSGLTMSRSTRTVRSWTSVMVAKFVASLRHHIRRSRMVALRAPYREPLMLDTRRDSEFGSCIRISAWERSGVAPTQQYRSVSTGRQHR